MRSTAHPRSRRSIASVHMAVDVPSRLRTGQAATVPGTAFPRRECGHVMPRTSGPLLLSPDEANAAELRRRTLAADELEASAGARLAPTSLRHLRKSASATGATAMHVTVTQRDRQRHPPRRASTPAERSVLRSHPKRGEAGRALAAPTTIRRSHPTPAVGTAVLRPRMRWPRNLDRASINDGVAPRRLREPSGCGARGTRGRLSPSRSSSLSLRSCLSSKASAALGQHARSLLHECRRCLAGARRNRRIADRVCDPDSGAVAHLAAAGVVR